MIAVAQRRVVVALGAAAGATFAGALVVAKPAAAFLLALGVAAVVVLAILGPRAYAASLILLAVVPWYPFVSDAAVGARVSDRMLCIAIAAAPVVPWLWSLGWGVRRRRPSSGVLLLGLVLASLSVIMYQTAGGLHPLFSQGTFGFLFGGVAFLCARRFAPSRSWAAPAFWGCVVLIVLGLGAYASSPGSRVGYFTGYPITYGALMTGLLPLALLHASRRSRPLTVGLGAAAGMLLILSQSRSSWVAVLALMVIVVLLLLRLGRWRELAIVAGVTVLGAVAIVQTGSLHKIVEAKLSSNVRSTDSVTHRAWSISYAKKQLRERPVFGAGQPGFAGDQAADQTDIGAVDNGYLSIGVDLGLVGLLAALAPIAIALDRLARWFRRAASPPAEDLALALGIVGIAVVTLFYDSYYWAQLDLLLFGMGGTLSARAVTAARRRRRRPRAARAQARPGLRAAR